MTPAEHDPAQRIAIGFDPGAAHVGWCALAGDSAGVRYIASGVLEIEPSDAGLAALRLGAHNLIVTHRPAVVAIERVTAVYVRGRFGASMASGLVGGAWTGGELAGLAHAHGIAIVTFSHTEAKIAIGAPAGDGRAVTSALRARVSGWPRVGEHQRDAGAVALAVLCQNRERT
jgi:Holliday junction resolvasome RuvABC endonuclease subunit